MERPGLLFTGSAGSERGSAELLDEKLPLHHTHGRVIKNSLDDNTEHHAISQSVTVPMQILVGKKNVGVYCNIYERGVNKQ